MKWSDAHDVHFLKEMMLFQPWQHKKGSTERGETWANLATCLGKYTALSFRVTQRSIRDRYLLLERKYKKKLTEEENASGISPELTEFDQLMEEIVSLFEEADRSEAEKKRKVEEEAAQIEEVRRVSLESLRETRERNADEKPKKKKRTSGADAIAFIKEKVQRESQQKDDELNLKKEEMELKKDEMVWERHLREQELEMRKKEHEERVRQQQDSTKLQEQTLNQMHNMNMAMLQQQQQQTQALLTLLQKFSNT